jgi:hypothetical protein
MSCDHLSSTLSCSNCPLCCRPSVFPVALLRGLYGGTVPAMDAIPPMPVEEHQVLDPRVVRQPVNEIQLGDGRAAPTSLLGIECANPHESPCAGLLVECGVELRDGHLRYLFGYHNIAHFLTPVNTALCRATNPQVGAPQSLAGMPSNSDDNGSLTRISTDLHGNGRIAPGAEISPCARTKKHLLSSGARRVHCAGNRSGRFRVIRVHPCPDCS